MRNRAILASKDEDCIFWCAAKSGEYNVKLGYEVQRHRVINLNWLGKLCWNNWILPKARAFLWIALHVCILTGDRLKTIGIHGPSWCVLCNTEKESVDYLLFNCTFARKCWEWFLRMVNLCTVRNGSLKEFLVSWPMFSQTKWGALWLVGPAMIVWLIWKERKKRIFKETSKPIDVVISNLKATIEEAICGKSRNVRKFRFNDWDAEMERNWSLKNVIFHYPKKKIDRENVRWTKPHSNLGQAEYGAVIRNEDGNILSGTYEHIGCASNNEEELRALEAGLLLCKQKGLTNVQIEGDSQIIINGVINSRFTNWKLAR
ncbi:uncharacterized protein LOC131049060 [Cryptomeria japonica]|uniref:uncharacterized protein LOC131049060 n=1 Tax=Cryptomeria japonica TaxID=3369 RepID=UPI0027D9FD83|nr:uncharacterized protein LOC131049060 [Cryptomeria japonica]